MSSSETILKAAFNRTLSRLKQKLIDTALEINTLTKDAPEKIQKEWEAFKNEVYEEADRLSKEEYERNKKEEEVINAKDGNHNPQDAINKIRLKVTAINQKVEDRY